MAKKSNAEKIRAQQFKAYSAYLAKMVTPEWCMSHQEIAAAWWGAGIVGGMFRAGWEAAKKARHP